MSNLRNKKVFSTNEMEDFEKVNNYSSKARKRIVLKSILGIVLIITGIIVYSEDMFPGTINSYNRRGGYSEVITIYPSYMIPLFLAIPGSILVNNGIRSYRIIYELKGYRQRYRHR
ncbi:MAG: hypothetical protein HS052_04455 [Thaumarchaeota archaeon]|nr:hypothetical protein [Nitrososphaerota archaeon]